MTCELTKQLLSLVMNYINENKKRPSKVVLNGKTYGLQTILSQKEIKEGLSVAKKFPKNITVCGRVIGKQNYKILYGLTEPKPQPKNEVYEYFCKTFGKKPQTIDECLQIINAKGYAYYYNDKYTNKESINRIQKRQGINCTDACHLFWNLAKALNYEVRCIHVKCRGGDGHVRLQLKHPKNTKGEWINRDPACALSDNGKGATCNWCLDGTVLAINPQWFMNDVLK